MPDPTFSERLQLKQTGPDEFENIHEPWEWPWAPVIPGGLLMSLCAAAAYRTLPTPGPDGFALDNLQSHFLRGISAQKRMRFKVSRLSNGKRFVVRYVAIEQEGVLMHAATMTFVSREEWRGPANRYAVKRKTGHRVEEITLDDLAFPGKKTLRPHMKFQRMPLVFQDEKGSLESGIVTSAAQTYPIDNPAGSVDHVLGILNLSDYHVLDVPLQLSGITNGIYAINDHSKTPTPVETKVSTSLNHTINFHVHDGFRADELTWIEVETPWARDGRAMMVSKIFTKEGMLIATCTQEGFYVLKRDPSQKAKSNL